MFPETRASPSSISAAKFPSTTGHVVDKCGEIDKHTIEKFEKETQEILGVPFLFLPLYETEFIVPKQSNYV
ncbi:hypothetical protein CDAR_375191 [Caerostris darwini]|uniref:Uncharacterized protein n=1 Tax=Caerostris darwini TaxID=1538125 RepID=A0AAV4R9A2_9ARAC|nr:hypothetical protein CDAR_375191 [Caerostris darwini]